MILTTLAFVLLLNSPNYLLQELCGDARIELARGVFSNIGTSREVGFRRSYDYFGQSSFPLSDTS